MDSLRHPDNASGVNGAGYAEVSCRSNFSLLEGASHPRELVAVAKALGHAGLGLCDLNTLSGAVRGHVAAREAGLRYAVGCRLRLPEGGDWLVWPTDRASYGRLARLLSLGKTRAPKGGFEVSAGEMVEHSRGWIVAAVPSDGPHIRERAAEMLARCAPTLGAMAPGLAMPPLVAAAATYRGDDSRRIAELQAVAGQMGGRLLATNDVLFHEPDRRRLADVLSAIRLGVPVAQLGSAAQVNAERHLKPATRMAHLFRSHGDALRASLEVLDAASSFSLSDLRHEYPDEIIEPGRTPQQTLVGRVAEALRERWPDGAPEDIRKRLRHELRVVETLGYAPYFLTVHEIVRFARSREILCQGRGSAANSTICFVLGITSVDPQEHDLLFERFVSASRGEPPDIDVDFEHERREEVFQHVYESYGRDRAAIVGTVIRFRPRSAIREVGKALGISEDVTSRLAKATWGPGRDRSLAEVAEGEGLDPGDRVLRMAIELAEEILDFPRHLATHVGGFVISRGPLVEMAVVQNAAMEGRTVLEWDKDDVEALGIMKVDLLALGMLSCIRRCLDLLRGHRVADLSLAAIPRNCEETYAMLRRADTVGVFQVESRAQMNMLPRVRPANFYDLVVQVALVRPGPIQGDMVHPYLRRRWGLEKPVYPAPSPEHGHPDELEGVLGRTLGVPLFQEQAMRLAIVAAGYTPDEADRLRRDMATFKFTGGVASHRERLVAGMVGRGYERAFAEQVFMQIEGFGSYGFPESHAASFARLAYASAWLKRHHPAAFTCALLNSQPMGFYAPSQLVRDARDHGVRVLGACVNHSEWDSALVAEAGSAGGFGIRLGLRLAAGLPQDEGRAVAQARRSGNGSPFASVADVARRAKVGKRALEALAAAGALDAVAKDRRGALWEARAVERDTPPLFLGDPAAPDREVDLFNEPEAKLPEETEGQSVVGDYRSTGLTLRRHPVAILRPELTRMGCCDTRLLATARSGSKLLLPGLTLMRQRPSTAKGVTFVTIEDEWGSANLVVWADVAESNLAALVGARLMIAEGRVERETEHAEVPVTHLIVRKLTDGSRMLDSLAMGEGAENAMPGSRDFR